MAAHDGKVWVIAGNAPGQQGPRNHGCDDTGIATAPVYIYTPGDWERGPEFSNAPKLGCGALLPGEVVCHQRGTWHEWKGEHHV